jgi:hypothetical protein
MSTRIAAELNELPPTISVERAARLLGLSRSAAPGPPPPASSRPLPSAAAGSCPPFA